MSQLKLALNGRQVESIELDECGGLIVMTEHGIRYYTRREQAEIPYDLHQIIMSLLYGMK